MKLNLASVLLQEILNFPSNKLNVNVWLTPTLLSSLSTICHPHATKNKKLPLFFLWNVYLTLRVKHFKVKLGSGRHNKLLILWRITALHFNFKCRQIQNNSHEIWDFLFFLVHICPHWQWDWTVGDFFILTWVKIGQNELEIALLSTVLWVCS